MLPTYVPVIGVEIQTFGLPTVVTAMAGVVVDGSRGDECEQIPSRCEVQIQGAIPTFCPIFCFALHQGIYPLLDFTVIVCGSTVGVLVGQSGGCHAVEKSRVISRSSSTSTPPPHTPVLLCSCPVLFCPVLFCPVLPCLVLSCVTVDQVAGRIRPVAPGRQRRRQSGHDQVRYLA